MKLRTAIALLLASAAAAAAPVPKPPAKKLEDVFGTPLETSGVTCEMNRRGELRVTASKDANYEPGNHQRPLFAKKVEGDFTLTFRVTHAPTKDAAAVGNNEPAVAAGVSVVSEVDAVKSLVLFQQHVSSRGTWKTQHCTSALHPKGGGGSTCYQDRLEEGPLHFRLARQGDLFTSHVSEDGKTWTTLGVHEIRNFGAAVIGPMVNHNTNAEHEAVFDEYEIKPLKEEKR